MASCSSAPDSSEAETPTNREWEYFDEMPSVPTPDSCIDEVVYETSIVDDEGNKVYGYYVSSNDEIANQKYNEYLEILENTCGFDFIKKPNIAVARKNGESLLGIGLGVHDNDVYILDVLFFENEQNSSSDVIVEAPSSEPLAEQKKQSATMGEQQALKKAGEYLAYTAFSYTGLIEQLEYEGFSHSESVYAADNCGADWNQQAAKKAQEYLDYTSFSRDGLISQLEYEGFTQSQAEYGASAVGY